MYRDDPLDDEAELRAVVGDAAVDELLGRAGAEAVGTAVDLLRIAQGWGDDGAIATWFASPSRRLDGLSPLAALARGAGPEVTDALRSWVAARG
jgi:hypothetical protein